MPAELDKGYGFPGIDIISGDIGFFACRYPELDPVASALWKFFNPVCIFFANICKQLPDGLNNGFHVVGLISTKIKIQIDFATAGLKDYGLSANTLTG